jgi:hypothetical protein
MTARAFLLAGIAAIAPAAMAQPVPAASSSVTAFTPPEGPVLISRTVVRSLFDGKEVRATRRYLVWFRPDPAGWRLEGELREVIVDVPPSLEQFAGLERNRVEPGFFPILLDAAGRLKPRSDSQAGDGSRAKAYALAEMMIAGALISPNARNDFAQCTQPGQYHVGPGGHGRQRRHGLARGPVQPRPGRNDRTARDCPARWQPRFDQHRHPRRGTGTGQLACPRRADRADRSERDQADLARDLDLRTRQTLSRFAPDLTDGIILPLSRTAGLLDFSPVIAEWAAFPRCRKRFRPAL